jgi:outer membrane protein TolC
MTVRLMRGGQSIVALTAVLLAAPALAQTTVEVPTRDVLGAGAYAPPSVSQPTITLGEAVSLAIRHSAFLRRSAERVRAAAGRQQETRGAFDLTFNASPRLDITFQQLTPFLRGREVGTRDAIQNVANQYTDLTLILRNIIDEVPTIPPRCPDSLQFGLSNVDVERRDDLELDLLGVTNDLRSRVVTDLTDTINSFDLGDICSTPVDPFFTPDAFGGALRSIDQSGGLGLGGVLTSVSQIPAEIRLLQEEIAHTVALRAKLALDRLGPVPADDLRRNFGFNIRASKLFRNGTSAAVAYDVQSQEHNFVDKPLDPSFGGLGVPPQFFSEVSATFTLPLARGRGRASTAAPEEATAHVLAGEQAQFQHDIAQDAFRVVLAYLNLVAGQETMQLLVESEARQQQIATVVGQQAAGGDVPQFEVGRAQARAASVSTQLAESRAAVDEARVALAEAMGVTVAALGDAPLAAETFAGVQAGSVDVTTAVNDALAARRDLRAAGYRRTAAAILNEGARADRRPRLDLSLTGGLSNLYESPFFRFLPDERDAIINQTATVPIAAVSGVPVPPDSPVRYWSPRGYSRSVSSRHEPFITANVTWELPFGNNAARGRAAQAEATLRSSSIEVIDLGRVIDDNIIGIADALSRSEAAIAGSTEAVARGADLLAGVLQQFQAGDITLLDTLVTEESVTVDLLQLVRRRQAYLSTLARLRFESGSLVSFEAEGTPGELVRFQPGDFVIR